MNTNAKNDKTITPAAQPEIVNATAVSDESGKLSFTWMVGQPNAGKSLIAELLTDAGNLIEDKKVFLGDGEEGSNLVFTRINAKRVIPTKIETQHDVEALITKMLDEGYDKGLLDLPGSSMRSVTRACGDFQDLVGFDTKFFGVIVVGTREGSERVAMDWLEILKDIDGIFWVWNNQDTEQPDNRELPKVLPAGVDRKKITEIRIPALRNDISREIITRGVPVSKVVAGLVPESVLLSHRMVKPKVARWQREAYEALAPILDTFKR